MYRYIDVICHAQASLCQVSHDLGLCCHFTLGFVVNLTKSALVPFLVMPHLGEMIDMARGLSFHPQPSWRPMSCSLGTAPSPSFQLSTFVK